MNSTIDGIKQHLQFNQKTQSFIENPIIKTSIAAVLNSIPVIGSLIDDSISRTLSDFQETKRAELIDTILCHSENITSDMVSDIEFIMNFAKTLDAVNRLAKNDKVKYFGNLLRNGYLRYATIDNSKFDEYLHIISTLSFREIEHLVFLYNYQKSQTDTKQTTERNIDVFLTACNQEYGHNNYEAYDIYKRLCHTGIVQESYCLHGTNVSRHSVRSEFDSEYTLDSTDIETESFYIPNTMNDFFEYIQEDTPNDQ